MRDAGLTGSRHLRHTATRLAVSSRADLKEVRRLLGHASAAMILDIYTSQFDDDPHAVA